MSIKYDPNRNLFAPQEELEIKTSFSKGNLATLYLGDCLDFLSQIPDQSIQLIITSPPYNIGKEYEKKLEIKEYIFQQSQVINECIRVLKDEGSICWEVGNYVDNGEIIPLDILLYDCFKSKGLQLRNRIQRLILALSNENEIVFDPFLGVGSTAIAGIMNKRKVAGSEIVKKYYDIACERVKLAYEGRLKIRPDKPVYEPTGNLSLAKNPFISENEE